MVRKANQEKKLKNKNVLIISHFYSQGPGSRLEEYLSPKVASLTYIGHPFHFSIDKRSFLKLYKNGKLIVDKKSFNLRGPEFIFWLRDILLTYFWFFKIKSKIDYCFAFDSLLVNLIYPLKFFKKIRTLIFYTIDFVPYRFSNKILNDFYHILEKSAVEKSDSVWNLSSRMTDVREEYGYSKSLRKKQITVPIGTDIKQAPLPFTKIDKHKIVYMGVISEQHGVKFLVEAMRGVVKQIPKTKLLLIGGGPDIGLINKKIRQFKLKKNIELTGFIEKYSEVEQKMRNAAIAVAPYVDNEESFTRYTDPGKPKDYISSGLPVIITKVPEISEILHKKKCGIAINYDKDELVKAIVSLLKETKKLKRYRQNAYKFAKNFVWEKIFDDALNKTKL